MSKATSFVCAAGAVALLSVPTAARAQVQAEFTPFFASYYALTEDGFTGTGVTEKQENEAGAGVSIGARLNQLLGIEGVFTFTPSGVTVTGDQNLGLSGTVMFADGRVRLWAPRSNLFGFVGGGVVLRGGDAWDAPVFTKLTTVQGVVGFGAQADVSRNVRFEVKAEVHVYSFDPDGSGTQWDSKMMPDVLVVVGLPIRLNRG